MVSGGVDSQALQVGFTEFIDGGPDTTFINERSHSRYRFVELASRNYCCSKINTSVKFTTARSSLPSPLKSAAAMAVGSCPTA